RQQDCALVVDCQGISTSESLMSESFNRFLRTSEDRRVWPNSSLAAQPPQHCSPCSAPPQPPRNNRSIRPHGRSTPPSGVSSYRGRSSLFLRDGSAWLKGTRFQNGTIEFDVVFSNVGGFPAIAFRAATHSDFELFYLRQSLSGPHATQYTPVLHGQWAWQIYSGPKWEGAIRWTYDHWMHVKLLVRGSRAELFVDGDSAVQVIGQLRGPNGAGEIGILSGNGARFANVVVRPDAQTPDDMMATPQATVGDSTPATVVRSWRVSAPFSESTLVNLTNLTAVPGGGAWTVLRIEERGIANLAR